MARLPRLCIANEVHHVLVRGNNQQSIFTDDEDRTLLKRLLFENCTAYDLELHTYVLMENHFHLLLTPKAASALSKAMQSIGRSYVRSFNQRHGRTGTLWEGRYRCAPLQAEKYLLAAMMYLDLNPVRAGLCAQAVDYHWSSHRHYTGQMSEPALTAPPAYWSLGNTPFSRENAYASLVYAGLDAKTQLDIQDSVLKGWALGDDKYLTQIAKVAQRRVVKAKVGRPKLVKLVE